MSLITRGLGGIASWLTTARFGVVPKDEDTPAPPPQIPGNGIFTKPWAPLITNGLGTSACCGLLLAGLGSFSCFVGVTPPPSGGGGGGGSYAVHPGIYVPWPSKTKRKAGARAIVVTVRFKDKKWTKSYMVDDRAANRTAEVLNVVNKTTSQLSVGASAIQKRVRKVTTAFTQK